MATAHEAFVNHQEEKQPVIIPYKLRRIFKMRDPYPVLVARNWGRDMAVLECVLFAGCMFVLASVTFRGMDDAVDPVDLSKDDDNIKVLGVELTGEVTLNKK